MNEKVKLMSEIIMLSMQLQEESEHVVFVRFSGHVDSMDIDVVQSKSNYSDKLARSTFSTKGDTSLERMQQVKEQFLEFLDEGFSTDNLDYWTEEVYHHTF